MVSKVQKWGNSLAVRIPKTFAEEVDLSEDSSVEITVQDGRIVVAPSRPEWQLSDLISGITRANTHREFGWGKRADSESW